MIIRWNSHCKRLRSPNVIAPHKSGLVIAHIFLIMQSQCTCWWEYEWSNWAGFYLLKSQPNNRLCLNWLRLLASYKRIWRDHSREFSKILGKSDLLTLGKKQPNGQTEEDGESYWSNTKKANGAQVKAHGLIVSLKFTWRNWELQKRKLM